MWCEICCHNNNIIPLSCRLVSVIKHAALQNVTSSDFVQFIYLLNQIYIYVLKNVGSHLCVSNVVDIFHFVTDGKHRAHKPVCLHVVKAQLWYCEILCKYIDYRTYERSEVVLCFVIPTYMPV